MNSFVGYSCIWGKKAVKELLKINANDLNKIRSKIKELGNNPDVANIKKLQNYSSLYRLKVGAYRVIFEANSHRKEIFIARVGLRKNIYRNLDFIVA